MKKPVYQYGLTQRYIYPVHARATRARNGCFVSMRQLRQRIEECMGQDVGHLVYALVWINGA
jgi:hypothetical protein